MIAPGEGVGRAVTDPCADAIDGVVIVVEALVPPRQPRPASGRVGLHVPQDVGEPLVEMIPVDRFVAGRTSGSVKRAGRRRFHSSGAPARALWPDGDPLGQQIRFRDGPTGRLSNPLSVVGLAPGRRNEIFDQQPTPHVYVPFGWQYRGNMTIHLRLAAGGQEAAQSMLQTVREEVRAFDERLPVLALKTLEDFRADSAGIWVVRAAASVFTTFGALALFLAVIGLYGVKAYVVSRRTREIGIRMALGADRGNVLWLVLREGLILTLAGLGIGLLLSFGTAQLLSSLLYEVSTLDPVVFILATLLLAASTLLASYLPARRATRVVPMVALREE